MPSHLTVGVAVENVPYQADIAYTYVVPEELEGKAFEGAVCTVPFGAANRRSRAVVLQVQRCDDISGLKSVVKFAPSESYSGFLGADTMTLVRYLKEKTFCTYFEAFRTVMPTGSLTMTKNLVLTEKTVKSEDCASVAELLAKADDPKASERTVRRADIVRFLLQHGETSVKTLANELGATLAVLRTMQKDGLVTIRDAVVHRDPLKGLEAETSPAQVVLNAEQQKAYDEMHAMLGSGKTHLLYGVTGSGKTLVYIRLIDDVLAQGKQAILLIPEISLTFQIVRRLYARYGEKLAILHSALSDGERCDTSKQIASGEKSVVVGTRSAVFAPVLNLGIIIIDEEQEHTYKSEMSPRYHARDIAAYIASRRNALLVLASATPSFETYWRAENGMITRSVLSQRFNSQPLPRILVADMHSEMMSGSRGTISEMLRKEIFANLQRGEQSILFINRRGYNTVISCIECGETERCPYCGITMTYHKNTDRLVCHYCGHTKPVPENCASCGSKNIRFSGAGTQKIQQELQTLFPDARILRMDADTVTGKNDRDDILMQVRDNKCDILLGTQMITKGLDFPNVTLVGVLSADMSLYSSDFRSYEKTFSVITQVVGRAGRAEKSGRAVIQTFSPSHRVLRYAFGQDYEGFYESEISFRRTMLYPPYCDMCQIVFIAPTLERSFEAANMFVDMLRDAVQGRKDMPLRVINPKSTSVPMVDGQYRVRILIKCRDTHAQRALLSDLYIRFIKNKQNKDVRTGIDMNPAVIY
ncbi:MAG: primosomal protein N' [Eubacteriales bacterium]